MPSDIFYLHRNEQSPKSSNRGDKFFEERKGLNSPHFSCCTVGQGNHWRRSTLTISCQGVHPPPWNWMPNFCVTKLKGAVCHLQLLESSTPVHGLKETRTLNWQTWSQVYKVFCKVSIKQCGEQQVSVLHSGSTSLLILYLAIICSAWGKLG